MSTITDTYLTRIQALLDKAESTPYEAEAEAFLAACPLIARTTSFGGTHSAAERRARWGDPVAPGFVRLSVGIEPVDALWAALSAALDG